MVEKTYGKAKAIMAGTFLPLSYEREHDPSTKKLLLSLARPAGVQHSVKISGEGTTEFEVRRLVSPQEQLIFVFNHADKPARASISIQVPWTVHQAWDIVADRPVEFKAAQGDVVLDRNLSSGEIWVVKLSSAA